MQLITIVAAGRAPRGQNKAEVLESRQGGGAKTASEIAKSNEIATATVSTLLTKLAKTGDVTKTPRATDYRTRARQRAAEVVRIVVELRRRSRWVDVRR